MTSFYIIFWEKYMNIKALMRYLKAHRIENTNQYYIFRVPKHIEDIKTSKSYFTDKLRYVNYTSKKCKSFIWYV